ncbi:PTS galactitol transporter subunit IIB [Marinilactibacillus psychrotolerans]|uniref:PTS galactitol transporter subunit IIB n=1 Tax=Marinilactibacillus psychrotolerans TaxID=191770 RepID=A0ABW8UJE0_9LACT
MKKRILVACGGAIATSTVVAEKIRELLKKEKIDADIRQLRISELQSNKDNADLIVTTAKVKKDYGVPLIHGVGFITGINQEKVEQQILKELKN